MLFGIVVIVFGYRNAFRGRALRDNPLSRHLLTRRPGASSELCRSLLWLIKMLLFVTQEFA